MKITINNSNPAWWPSLKEWGFDGCDYNLEGAFNRKYGIFKDIDNVTDEQIRDYYTDVRKQAEAIGFEIGQTHAEFSGHPRDYDGDIDEVVKRQIACIKATHYLGAKHCVIHPVIMRERVYDKYVKENFDAAVDFYKKLTPYLEEYDVYCCIENMWNCDPVYSNICATILSHATEMVEMCEVLGERFKICLDVGHALITQDDPVEAVRICGDKLACLHTHDNDGISDLHDLPFHKVVSHAPVRWKPLRINWIEFMKALDEVNYRGNLNYEIGMGFPEPFQAAAHKYLAEISRILIAQREIQY